MEKGTMEDKEVSVKMIHLAEKNNISFLIVNDTTGKGYTNVYDSDMLVNQLRGYSLNQAQKGSKILESTKEYQISQSFDPWNQTDYIEMWGSFDDGSRFLLRSPLESIKESAAVSNRFLIYIGSLLIQMCIRDRTKHDESLTEAQKQDEISLHMMGYIKSCTNEIIIEVLAEILGLEDSQ